jgi:hypothetical protein
MYFKQFPTFTYDFTINGKTEYLLVKDISQNVRVRKEILANITLYDEYDIKDGETPEMIAEKVYGSPLYHWVVMLCNQKYNYIDDFPLPTFELQAHVTEKYGAGNEYNTHHYIDTNGNIVDASQSNITSVSNYDYELRLNESKRRIKLISPQLLNIVIKNFKDIL